jgi:hypothetical protein
VGAGNDDLATTYAMNFMAAHAGGEAAWAVDLHTGGRWVQVVGCPSKALAKQTLDHLVEKGVSPAVLRVRRLPAE